MGSETVKKDGAETAKRIAQVTDKLGSVNSTISLCIRSIKANNSYDAPRGGLDDISRFELSRYLKAPSVKIPFYFAAERRMSDEQRAHPRSGSTEIIEAFNAHEIASILALTYVFKRLRTRIEADEDWQRVAKSVEEQIEIGARLGDSLPSIGYADGILVGGIRPLALGLFFLVDAKGYKDYRRDLKIKSKTYDLGEEEKRWGITHLDVACRLLLLLGFGQELASNFYNGLSKKEDSHLTDEQLRMRLLGLWIESLAVGSAPPKIRGEEKHQATNSCALDELFDICSQVRVAGLDNYWISRGKKDVNKQTHPKLFAAGDLNQGESADDIDM